MFSSIPSLGASIQGIGQLATARNLVVTRTRSQALDPIMSINLRLISRTRCSAKLLRLSTNTHKCVHELKRGYATQRNSMDFGGKSQLLESLDTRQQQRSEPKHDNVGPFQLGLSQAARKGDPVKKWSELSTGGKGS